MIKIYEEKSGEVFNSLAMHPLQSWEWGQARKEMGIEVLRLQESKNIFQITFHKIPYTDYKIGYLPRSAMPSESVIEFLNTYCRKNNVLFVKIEPYVLKSEIRNSRLINNKLRIAHYELIKSAHPLFPDWTQILDLTRSEEELLKNMHPKTRYNIRLARKKGVAVEEIADDSGFETFIDLYFKTTGRQKYHGHNRQYHRLIWKNLKKNISHLLLAFYDKTPLAAYEIFNFKDRAYYVYGGTSDKHRNLMAANLLMWEAILYAKRSGAKKFDMWGSLPPDYDPDHPWAGFTRFKQGYGGEFTQFIGSYDLVVYPVLYKIYNQVFRFRSLFLKLKQS